MRKAGCGHICAALLLVLLALLPAAAQEEAPSGGFIGRGRAAITGDDVAGARQEALQDAQQKVLIDAVCSLMTARDLAAHFGSLNTLCFSKPEAFLDRYKIVDENALPDVYQITLEGFVQRDALMRELASLGVVKSETRKLGVLFMIAEKDMDRDRELFWWSAPGSAVPAYGVQQMLAVSFAGKGLESINPLDAPAGPALQSIEQNPAPDTDSLCLAASQLGAQIVIAGRAELTRPAGDTGQAGVNIQCEITARALEVRSKMLIVQAVTYALGTGADDASAARDAAEKASRQFAEQVTDKLYRHLRNAHEYVFRLTFNRPMTDLDVHQCMNAFTSVLTGIEIQEITGEPDSNVWSVKCTSPAESTAMLKKMFGAGVPGYVAKITSARDNVVEMMVTPIKKSTE